MTPELPPNFPEESSSEPLAMAADIVPDGDSEGLDSGEDRAEVHPLAEIFAPGDDLPPVDEMAIEAEKVVSETVTETETSAVPPDSVLDQQELASLLAQKQLLQRDIAALEQEKAQWYGQQFQQLQGEIQKLVREGTRELAQKKVSLEKEIEKLERRQERIQQEMRTTFAGASQELAIRVQGFKDYLVGSLQDLVSAADQLELGVGDSWESSSTYGDSIIENADAAPMVAFSDQGFSSQKRQIQNLLEQYRTRPDYYGPPWQLRRTFEPIHAEKIENWFFNLGGRGAIPSLDSRLQNILVGSAAIAILNQLYGDKSRALILAATPERLGEWRRGLQDCLGISRSDFGPERGVALFESPSALIQRAERLIGDRQMPLVLIDETEEQIDLAMLQFPLLLAFAPNYQSGSSSYFS